MAGHSSVVGLFVFRKREAQPANQYLASAGVEFDESAVRAAQIEREYLQALVEQDVSRRLTILRAHCPPPGTSGKDRQHVRSSEPFDLYFAASRAKSLEPANQIADGEVDLAVALRTFRLRRAGGQHAVAQRPQAEVRAPERDPDAGAENGLEQARLANQLHFPRVQVELGQFISDGG